MSTNNLFSFSSKIHILAIIGGIVFIFFLHPKSTIAGDFDVRTFTGAQTKIKNIDLFLHSANFFRAKDNWFLNHTQISLYFPSKNHFNLGVGYKQEYVEFSEKWRKEYRPFVQLYYTKQFGDFEFRDRNMWEFRILEGQLINRYRNQLQLGFRRINHLLPYLSTELSWFIDPMDFSRLRTLVGVLFFLKHVNLNLFWGHELNENSPGLWSSKLMLGTAFSYRF